MKKLLILLGTALLLFLFESGFLGRIPIRDTVIPLTFTFGLVVSIYGSKWDALAIGLFTGFIVDIYSARFFGINMLLNMWVFVGAWKISGYLRRENKVLMSIFMALTTLFRFSVQTLIFKAAGVEISYGRVTLLALMVLLISYPSVLLYRKVLKPRQKRKIRLR